jgi:hypothetical protein
MVKERTYFLIIFPPFFRQVRDHDVRVVRLLSFLYLVFTLFSFFGQVRDHDVRVVLRGVAECILHRRTFLKVLYIVTLHRKYTGALTFENVSASAFGAK